MSAAPETGTDASDFTLNGTTLTIPEGQTSSTGTVTVTANEDADEDHERVRVSATAAAAGSGAVAAPAAATLAIRDNDVTNVAATGAPTISGTAQAGQTLRASSGTIADADGLTGPSMPGSGSGSRATRRRRTSPARTRRPTRWPPPTWGGR